MYINGVSCLVLSVEENSSKTTTLTTATDVDEIRNHRVRFTMRVLD